MCVAGFAGSGTLRVPVDAGEADPGATARLLTELEPTRTAAESSTAAEAPSDKATQLMELAASATAAAAVTAQATVVPCKDETVSCTKWAEAGECTKNAEFMQTKCMKSCGLCMDDGASSRGTNGSSGEHDKNRSCGQWAARGECSTNPKFMLANCPVSCASTAARPPNHDES